MLGCRTYDGADAETLEKMRKEGHARGFTVYCDEVVDFNEGDH